MKGSELLPILFPYSPHVHIYDIRVKSKYTSISTITKGMYASIRFCMYISFNYVIESSIY